MILSIIITIIAILGVPFLIQFTNEKDSTKDDYFDLADDN